MKPCFGFSTTWSQNEAVALNGEGCRPKDAVIQISYAASYVEGKSLSSDWKNDKVQPPSASVTTCSVWKLVTVCPSVGTWLEDSCWWRGLTWQLHLICFTSLVFIRLYMETRVLGALYTKADFLPRDLTMSGPASVSTWPLCLQAEPGNSPWTSLSTVDLPAETGFQRD